MIYLKKNNLYMCFGEVIPVLTCGWPLDKDNENVKKKKIPTIIYFWIFFFIYFKFQNKFLFSKEFFVLFYSSFLPFFSLLFFNFLKLSLICNCFVFSINFIFCIITFGHFFFSFWLSAFEIAISACDLFHFLYVSVSLFSLSLFFFLLSVSSQSHFFFLSLYLFLSFFLTFCLCLFSISLSLSFF